MINHQRNDITKKKTYAYSNNSFHQTYAKLAKHAYIHTHTYMYIYKTCILCMHAYMYYLCIMYDACMHVLCVYAYI